MLSEQAVSDAADALFLPPRVLKARKRDPNHWAKPENGWRPQLQPPEVVQPLALPAGVAKDLFVEAATEKRLAQKRSTGEIADDVFADLLAPLDAGEQGQGSQGLTLQVSDADDGMEYELLSPEESEAKTAIWDEVNREIRPVLERVAGRKKAQKQEELIQQQKEDERLEMEQQLEKVKMARRELARAKQRSDEERSKEAKGDLDDLFEAAEEQVAASLEMDFWKAHAASHSSAYVSSNALGSNASQGAFAEAGPAEGQSEATPFEKRIAELFGSEDPRRKIRTKEIRRSRTLNHQLRANLDSVQAE